MWKWHCLSWTVVVVLLTSGAKSFSTEPTSGENTKLFPFQREGVKRLIESKRLLLGDEMGLGKTVQCIEAMNHIDKPDPTILVICPKSVLGVWENEIQSWLKRDLVIQVVTAGGSPPQPVPGSITLINYDICYKYRKDLQSINYDVIVCDEAHYLKSADAKRTQAILGGSRKHPGITSHYLWLLTGTPILNRPAELFPLLRALSPTQFGSFDEYADRYCGKPKLIPLRGGRGLKEVYSGASNLQELSKKLEPIMLRRYKVDVLQQLPPKVRSCVCLTTTEDTAELERGKLRDLLSSANSGSPASGEGLHDFGSEAQDLLSYLGMFNNLDLDDLAMRNQIMGYLAIIRRETALSKLEPAVELLQDIILEEKVVVFAHHRELILQLTETFGKQAVSVLGGTSMEERSQAVEKFQKDERTRIFVGSIRAAGVGLTLTAASRVVFLELDWSPSVMTQAEDRCHRIGQQDCVRVQYYVFKNTIDEWVAKSLLYKQSNIDQILPERLAGKASGYVFDFGKYKNAYLEDAPRTYIQFLLKEEVWRARPKLWQALSKKGLVFEEPPPHSSDDEKMTKNHEPLSDEIDVSKTAYFWESAAKADVSFTFDFGKYSGKEWNGVPDDYKIWLLRERVWKNRPNLKSALATAGVQLNAE